MTRARMLPLSPERRPTVHRGHDPSPGPTLNANLNPDLQADPDPNPSKVQVSREARDLLKELLEPNPTRRIPLQCVLAHPWFLRNLPPGYTRLNEALLVRRSLPRWRHCCPGFRILWLPAQLCGRRLQLSEVGAKIGRSAARMPRSVFLCRDMRSTSWPSILRGPTKVPLHMTREPGVLGDAPHALLSLEGWSAT